MLWLNAYFFVIDQCVITCHRVQNYGIWVGNYIGYSVQFIQQKSLAALGIERVTDVLQAILCNKYLFVVHIDDCIFNLLMFLPTCVVKNCDKRSTFTRCILLEYIGALYHKDVERQSVVSVDEPVTCAARDTGQCA